MKPPRSQTSRQEADDSLSRRLELDGKGWREPGLARHHAALTPLTLGRANPATWSLRRGELESGDRYRQRMFRACKTGVSVPGSMWRATVLAAVIALVAAAAAWAWPGPPTSAAPRLDQPGPAPAWVESATVSRWLAFSSYCWKTSCVDMLPPATRPDLPLLKTPRNQLLRFHLRFAPARAQLTVLNGGTYKQYRLQPGRVLTWRAAKGGVLSLDVRAGTGSASYVIRLVLR